MFRTTGVSLDLQITYSNTNEQQRAEVGKHTHVHSTIKATVQTGAWSSVGGSVTYNVVPSGAVGAQTCVAPIYFPAALGHLPRRTTWAANSLHVTTAYTYSASLPGGSSLLGTSRV